MLRETDSQTTMWELLLPEEAKRLPAELVRIDAYLNDEQFIAPWRKAVRPPAGAAVSSNRHAAAAAVPETPLPAWLREPVPRGQRLIGWRRFCRIGPDRPVPHPTTLVKLVRRAGPEVIQELNAALLEKLVDDKLLRARKLRVDTTVVEADIDYPTDADLLEHAVRKLVGCSAGSRPEGRPAGPGSAIEDARLGGG